MTIGIKYHDDGKKLIISVKRKFDFTLLNEFRQAYSNDTAMSAEIVIDLRSTSTLDSSALGMLLNMQEYLGKKDGEITIINCNADVMKVFNITHFENKFTIKVI